MQAIAEFAQKLHDDPALLARVEAAEPSKRHAILEAAGIEVTPELQEEASAAVQRLGIDPANADSWTEVELSEDELAALAGGSQLSNVAISAGVTAGSAGVGAVLTVVMAVALP